MRSLARLQPCSPEEIDQEDPEYLREPCSIPVLALLRSFKLLVYRLQRCPSLLHLLDKARRYVRFYVVSSRL